VGDSAPIVDLRGVSRRYGMDPPVDALRGVDLTVDRGEWLAIVGPSGSGKSTLLNILGCLDRQTSGTYLFDGIDVNELDEDQRAGLRSRAIGFVFQSFHLLANRSVLENVMIAEIYRGEPAEGRERRALAALERVQLGHRASFLPTKLSGGERQRVAIARALIGSPELLLCDELTGNLDSATANTILQLIADLGEEGQQGPTIIMITHDLNVAARAGREVRIIDGVLTEAA
jgi:macrolide transport system ATP-binding/permease protein